MSENYSPVITSNPAADNPDSLSSRNTSLSRTGGILEYQVSSTEEAQVAGNYRSPNIQAGIGGTTTVNAGGDTVSQGVTTVSTADLVGSQTDFLATARNNGFPARGDLTPETVVNYGGMEVDLATLEGIGAVKRTATGYEAVTAGTPDATQHQQGGSGGLPDGVEPFSDAVETQVGQALAGVSPTLIPSVVAQVLESGLDGVNFNDLAYQSGITPAEAQQRAQVVLKAFTAQADSIAKAQGIDNAQEVWDWASAERPDDFANARREMAFGRNPQAIRGLVADYFREVPPAVEALKKAGFQMRTDGSGETVFNLQGVWMSPASAARAGLI
jgi:hypothetical protein